MLKRELTGAIIGNSRLANLKDRIRSFAVDNSWRFKLDKVAEQRLIEATLERTVKAGDSGASSIAKVELASLQITLLW